MKLSFGKRNPERKRHLQDEATINEITVPAFSALIGALVNVRIRILKDELHLHFNEQLKAKDEKIKALKARIKDLNSEIETANRLSRKSEWPRKPHSVISEHFPN